MSIARRPLTNAAAADATTKTNDSGATVPRGNGSASQSSSSIPVGGRSIAARIQALQDLGHSATLRTQAILALREELTTTAYLELLLTYKSDFLICERRMVAVRAMAELRPSLLQRGLDVSADMQEALDWIRRLHPPTNPQQGSAARTA